MGNSREATGQRLNFLHRRLESAQKEHRPAIDQLVKLREVARKAKKQKRIVNSHKSGDSAMRRKGARRLGVVA